MRFDNFFYLLKQGEVQTRTIFLVAVDERLNGFYDIEVFDKNQIKVHSASLNFDRVHHALTEAEAKIALGWLRQKWHAPMNREACIAKIEFTCKVTKE
jgi:hypothetical protein